MLQTGQLNYFCQISVACDLHTVIARLPNLAQYLVRLLPYQPVDHHRILQERDGQAATEGNSTGRDNVAESAALQLADLDVAFEHEALNMPVDGSNSNAKFPSECGLRSLRVAFDLFEYSKFAHSTRRLTHGFHSNIHDLNYTVLLIRVNPLDRPLPTSYTAAVISPGLQRFRQRHLRPAIALLLLLIVQLSLGVARIDIVPLGFNVDELWHFSGAKNVAAACMRQFFGMSWTLYDEPNAFLTPEDWPLVDPANPNAAPCVALGRHYYATSIGYYLLAGAPLAAFNEVSPRAALNLGRMISLILGLLATTLTFSAARELFPHPISTSIGAAIIVGLNQHLNDIMTGLNTDAAGACSVTLLYWTLARIDRRGITGRRLLICVFALGTCLVSKTSAWVGLPIAIFWLSVRMPKRARRAMLIGGGAIIGLGILALRPNYWIAAAHWFVQDDISGQAVLPVFYVQNDAFIGNAAFYLPLHDRFKAYVQYLPESRLRELRGRTVTIGGWVRAPASVAFEFPAIETNSKAISQPTTGTGAWQYRALTTVIAADTAHLAFTLHGPPSGELYYDGLFMVAGEHDTNFPPTFDTPVGSRVSWTSGDDYENVLLNPSAEQYWPSFQFTRIIPENLTTDFLWSILSWRRTWRAWLQLPGWFFTMYWSGFGGANPGLSRLQLLPLAGLSILATAGLITVLSGLKLRSPANRLTKNEHKRVWLLLLTGALVWLIAVVRSDIYPQRATMLVFAGARHALPATFPTATLLMLGLLRCVPQPWQRWVVGGLALLLFGTALYILIGVQIPFIHCPFDPRTLCLEAIR